MWGTPLESWKYTIFRDTNLGEIWFAYLRFDNRYTGDSGAKNTAEINAKIGIIGANTAIVCQRNPNPKAYISKQPRHLKTLSNNE